MWFDCTKTSLKKMKVPYNNSLRRFMGLPWHNNHLVKCFNVCIQFSFKDYDIKEFDVVFTIVRALFILIYGIGGKHSYLLTCD